MSSTTVTATETAMREHDAPVEEDSVLFQICFYYGLLVVFVEVFLPLLFKRRLRLVLPNMLVLALAPRPLGDAAFAQQKTQLGAQIRELQRATSAAKTQRRKSVDVLRLSGTKATPVERPASALRSLTRVSKSSEGKRRSATKSASATSVTSTLTTGTGAASSSSTKTRRRQYHTEEQVEEHSAVYTQVSSAGATLQPSKLNPPSRPYFATSPLSARSTEQVRASASTSTADTATRSSVLLSLSALSSRHSSDEHQPLERRPTTGGSARSLRFDTPNERRARREQHQRLQHEDVWQQESDDPHASTAPQSVTSEGFDRRALLHDDERPEFALHYDAHRQRAFGTSEDEEEQKMNEVFATDAPTQRSIGQFAPTRHSLFDDSDEEFLSEIRRPRSPAAMARPHTFASFDSEQMDVERTIAAAFGGRSLGGSVPVHHYQPMTATAAPAQSPLPVAAASHHHVNIYEQQQLEQHARTSYAQQQFEQQTDQSQQQRRQFITGRRESPAAREDRTPLGATNYRDVPRDRTPRIIRRIAFDEEMMALAATPDARSRSGYASADGGDNDNSGSSAAGEKRKRSVIFSPEDEAPDFSRQRTRF